MEILESIFKKLNYGVTDGKDDFHTMIFSNIINNKVDSRCVILRHFDKDKRILIFNTDIRSPKVSAIRDNPETHCLFYHFKEKIQLRITTHSTVHYNDEFHSVGWKNTAISSRKCYLTKYKPSQEIDSMEDGIPIHLLAKIPTVSESEAGKFNFAVIVNRILSIDWLYLSSKGHKRARYDFDNELIKKCFVAP